MNIRVLVYSVDTKKEKKRLLLPSKFNQAQQIE